MATRFKGIAGVKDFYQVITASFPDFQITVAGEYDMPGCSIREVLINGTHLGEYGGVPMGRKFSAGLYLRKRRIKMKSRMKWFLSTAIVIALCAFLTSTLTQPEAYAQDSVAPIRRAPHCTNGTASGTYGYRMAGQIVGVGPFLVNGIFTHNPDGTMDADVQLVVGNQTFPAPGTGGAFKTNDDCTGSGKFRVAALNLDVTYNFVVTDGGEQIELLNTNAGVVLHGAGRRISKPGRAPRCNIATVLGAYGGRLDGSIPGVPAIAIGGTITHSIGSGYSGLITGADTISLAGQFAPRTYTGTYTLGSNCRGTGFYTDSLGNRVNYVFTAVDGGETIYFQGADPGVAVSGVGRRIR